MGKTVTLAHGAGGKQTSELIHEVFAAHFANPLFTADDAAVLDMDKKSINIKGTTTEKLGFTGRGEGIAAQAVCTLVR